MNPSSRSAVALLRGINVGGKNIVSMAELAQQFRDAGYGSVRTYIQSGNVVFTTSGGASAELEDAVEQMLESWLGVPITVVVLSAEELDAVVEAAPADHGAEHLRSDVLFLKRPLTPDQALAEFPPLREGVDGAAPGPGVVYFSRVAAQASTSRLTRIVGTPLYQRMTVRNWRTTTRLRELVRAAGEA